MCVTSTTLPYMPSCIIETLDLVPKIRRRAIPSISIEMEEVSCSNKTDLKDAMAAFSGVLRWRELSSHTPRFSFSGSLFLSGDLAWLRMWAYCRRDLSASNAQLGSFCSSKPCRAFPSEVPYTVAFITSHCSLGP
jgi:hypothetical protein